MAKKNLVPIFTIWPIQQREVDYQDLYINKTFKKIDHEKKEEKKRRQRSIKDGEVNGEGG